MSIHLCRVCGVKLSRKNAYKNPKNRKRYRRICKECSKKERSDIYSKNNKKFWLIRGERYTLIFRSQDERRSFTTIRRLQKRFGKPKTSSSSNFGRSIDTKVFKKTDDDKRFFVYERVLCDDPDCKGIVRFDDHGYQVCEQCGLIRDEFPYEQTYDLTLADQTANYNRNNLPVVDKYYSNAYKRRYS